jgi:putative ABC transport system permease protein
MRLADRVKSWVRTILTRGRMESEMDAELRFHIEARAEDLAQGGMHKAEAMRRARMEFGGIEGAKEECREARGAALIENFLRDLRYSARILWRNPGFSAVAVLTLALGIGSTTAIFSVVYAALLKATPYPDAERLVRVHERGPLGAGMSVSPQNFVDWKRATMSFDGLSIFHSQERTIGKLDPPIRARGAGVSGDFFAILGAPPEVGRGFSDSDDRPGAAPVVVLSHGFWQQRFGGDANIIGRTMEIDGRVYTVIGVMQNSLDFPEHTQFWMPAGLFYDDWKKYPRSVHFVEAIGKLKPGISLERSSSDLNAIANDLAQKYPTTNQGFGVALTPLHEDVVSDVRPALLALLASVGFVLLIACANVANLLLGRALQRKKDLAIRLALGASRLRVMQQLLGESVMLALVGGALGIGFAVWSTVFLTKLVSQTLPHAQNIRVNAAALSFTLAVAVLTGILSGLAPILQSFRADVNSALNESGRSGTGGVERQRMRSALVIGEIALSFVLLIAAGLMVKTFAGLAAVDLGFRPDHLLTMKISLPDRKYSVEPVLRKIREVPGVLAAGVVNPLPISGDGWQDIFVQPGEVKRTMADVSWSHFISVSPGYFEAMGIPLVAGRLFDEGDGEAGREAAIVDEMFVKRYWPNENPLGKRIKNSFDSGDKEPWIQVVGVVGHIKNSGPEQSWEGDPVAETYFPYKQERSPSWYITARTGGDPGSMTAALTDAVHSVDRGIPVSDVRTMQERVGISLQYRRFSMLLLATFASIGMALAIVGVYGVLSYSVTQRLHEVGVRMALGADGRDIVQLILGEAVKLAGIGLAAGLVLALLLSGLLAKAIFGVTATDPQTFAVVSILLAAAALAAGVVPVRRATCVDPMIALRHE